MKSLIIMLTVLFTVSSFAKLYNPKDKDHPCRAELDKHCTSCLEMRAKVMQKKKACVECLMKVKDDQKSDMCKKAAKNFYDMIKEEKK